MTALRTATGNLGSDQTSATHRGARLSLLSLAVFFSFSLGLVFLASATGVAQIPPARKKNAPQKRAEVVEPKKPEPATTSSSWSSFFGKKN